MNDHETPPVVLDRRRFLQGASLVGVAAFLAACTGTKSSAAPGGAASPSAEASGEASPSASGPPASQAITGPLLFANWPAYIDLAGTAGEAGEYSPGSSPTLEQFKTKYGVDVDYQEKIDANQSFIETIKPAFVGGLPTGWDLIVVTDFMASKVVTSGWAEKIDQASVPNAAKNLRDALRNQTWDPGNDYHYPWQSGMTGMGVNTKTLKDNKIPEPTKLAALWDIPSDKVTFLEEARDTFPLVMLKLGIDPDPAKVTDANLQAVYDDVKPLVGKGLRFTGNSYLQDFGQKKVWGAMVWSGDLASSGGPDDKFIFPDEGVMVWTDNLIIPKGAANKYTAELMIDFVYDPKIAAQIAAYVYYVSPVNGAAEAIKAIDDTAADNPLLFPPADIVAKQHNFQSLSDEIETKLNDLFANLSGT